MEYYIDFERVMKAKSVKRPDAGERLLPEIWQQVDQQLSGMMLFDDTMDCKNTCCFLKRIVLSKGKVLLKMHFSTNAQIYLNECSDIVDKENIVTKLKQLHDLSRK